MLLVNSKRLGMEQVKSDHAFHLIRVHTAQEGCQLKMPSALPLAARNRVASPGRDIPLPPLGFFHIQQAQHLQLHHAGDQR